MKRCIGLVLCGWMCWVGLAVPVAQASLEMPRFLKGNVQDIKRDLNKKGGKVFNVVISAVVIIAGIAYAVAAAMLVRGRPQEARSLGFSTTGGLMMAGLIGAIVSVFVG